MLFQLWAVALRRPAECPQLYNVWFPWYFPTCLVQVLTLSTFPLVASFNCCFLIDVSHNTNVPKWRSITYSWYHIESFLHFRAERVPAPWRICIRSRRSHPDTPMDQLHPPILAINTFSPLNRDQRIASYSSSPHPHGLNSVWYNPKPGCSATVADTWTTPPFSVRLHCPILNTFPPAIILQNWELHSTKLLHKNV